jgi:hypothetical protein
MHAHNDADPSIIQASAAAVVLTSCIAVCSCGMPALAAAASAAVATGFSGYLSALIKNLDLLGPNRCEAGLKVLI